MKTMTTLLTISLTALLTTACNNSDSTSIESGDSARASIDLSTYTMQEPTETQKYALAYMWNEERLAHDIYLNLYALYPQNQFKNIANNSETKHIELVQNLVEYYDLNITNLVDYKEHYSVTELEAMPSGVYAIAPLQDLYDTLYAEGSVSAQAALQVGCKVEVTDIDDLREDIISSAGNQAMLDTFNILLDGSYKHYWAFDKGLKNNGVSDGCCSLGDYFCKDSNDYPQ